MSLSVILSGLRGADREERASQAVNLGSGRLPSYREAGPPRGTPRNLIWPEGGGLRAPGDVALSAACVSSGGAWTLGLGGDEEKVISGGFSRSGRARSSASMTLQ